MADDGWLMDVYAEHVVASFLQQYQFVSAEPVYIGVTYGDRDTKALQNRFL